MSLDRRFADAMGQLLGPDFPPRIGLAVSGGGDSMAMLYLAHNWSHRWGVRLHVVTVDHGLRPESVDEAAMVAGECRILGWPHETLRWQWDGLGNKMDAARRGRLALIDRWRGEIGHVLMAHTQDDVAETFLMRLARGSGVEGLSAMAARRWIGSDGPALDASSRIGNPAGFEVIRPCLDMTRAELRHYLTVLKGRWVDDPSNDDPLYERARMRQALPALAALGLDVATLAGTAGRLARARDALAARAAQVWEAIGTEGHAGGAPTGEVLFDRAGFEGVERDTQLRLLAAALRWVATAEYRPRAEPLEALLDRLLGGGSGTLHGCEAVMERDRLRVFREFAAVAALVVPLREHPLWDGRWQMRDAWAGEAAARYDVRALGEDGWAQVPADARAEAQPFRSARALPSIWEGGRLVACDPMGLGPRMTASLRPMGARHQGFRGFLLQS